MYDTASCLYVKDNYDWPTGSSCLRAPLHSVCHLSYFDALKVLPTQCIGCVTVCGVTESVGSIKHVLLPQVCDAPCVSLAIL